MATAASPAATSVRVFTRRRVVLTLLVAVMGLFGLDALLFRTHIYMQILEPESSAGLVELIMWRETRALRTAGDNLVEAFGNSRMCLVPKVVDKRAKQTGYAFRSASAPGSDPRAWYYMLRELDPTARRYRAVMIGVDDYDDEDGAFHPDDDLRELHYCIGRLRLGDALEFAESFHTPSIRWAAFRGAVLKGIALQSDIQAFLAHPSKRLAYIRLCHQGWTNWTYDYVESSRNMVGLEIDWSKLTAQYPPGMTDEQKGTVRDWLLRGWNPQSGREHYFKRTWLGRIADRYRNSRTKVIFFRLPRGPIPRPAYLVKKLTSSVRELATLPNVVLVDQDFFDGLERPELFKDAMHLNQQGLDLASGMMADAVARILGPAGGQSAR